MNIKTIFASAAALALVAGTPAFAAKSQSDAQAAGGSEAKQKGERKICKMFDKTASRVKRERLCLTEEQWKKFEAEQ